MSVHESHSFRTHRALARRDDGVPRRTVGRCGITPSFSMCYFNRLYADCQGENGTKCAYFSPAASERRELVEGFRQGRIRVLVNVDIFSEGFDCPDVEFVQLARPTLSLAKYLQQVGRGLRKSGDKESCMLIDNVGLHRIFGLPVRERDWEAMFEGRILGDTFSRKRAENGLSVACSLLEEGRREEEWEMVMTHGAGQTAALRKLQVRGGADQGADDPGCRSSGVRVGRHPAGQAERRGSFGTKAAGDGGYSGRYGCGGLWPDRGEGLLCGAPFQQRQSAG